MVRRGVPEFASTMKETAGFGMSENEVPVRQEGDLVSRHVGRSRRGLHIVSHQLACAYLGTLGRDGEAKKHVLSLVLSRSSSTGISQNSSLLWRSSTPLPPLSLSRTTGTVGQREGHSKTAEHPAAPLTEVTLISDISPATGAIALPRLLGIIQSLDDIVRYWCCSGWWLSE